MKQFNSWVSRKKEAALYNVELFSVMYVSSPATLSICFREFLSTYSQLGRFGTASVQFTAIASEFMPSNLWLIMQLGRDKWTLCALSIAYRAIPWAGFRWWSVIMHCYANAVGNVLQLNALYSYLKFCFTAFQFWASAHKKAVSGGIQFWSSRRSWLVDI